MFLDDTDGMNDDAAMPHDGGAATDMPSEDSGMPAEHHEESHDGGMDHGSEESHDGGDDTMPA